jgi:hypothetical protein
LIVGVDRAPRFRPKELVVRAFDAAVVQLAAAVRPTAEKALEAFVRREDIDRPGRQLFADIGHVVIRGFSRFPIAHAFAIGRIADNHAVFASRLKLQKIELRESDVA